MARMIRCMGNPKCVKDCGECAKLPRTPEEENTATGWQNWKGLDKPCAKFAPIVAVK